MTFSKTTERILLVIQDVTLCKRQQRVIEADKEQLGSLTEELLMIEEHTRDLMFELSPSTLYTLGLPAALEELADQFAESEGFRCQVEGPGDSVPLNEQGFRLAVQDDGKGFDAVTMIVPIDRGQPSNRGFDGRPT